MSIVYVTDLCGNIEKYNQLLAISETLNPKYIILNSNILSKKTKNCESEIKEVLDILIKMKCSKIFYQFGGDDFSVKYKQFKEINTCDHIVDITNGHSYTDDYTIIRGINFHPDHHMLYLKDWTVRDGYYTLHPRTTNGFLSTNTKKNLSFPINRDQIKTGIDKRDSMFDTLVNFNGGHKKTILVSHCAPIGVMLDCSSICDYRGSYDLRKYIEIYDPLMVLCSGSNDNYTHSQCWNFKLKDTICINPDQKETDLYFCTFDLNGKKISNLKHSRYI